MQESGCIKKAVEGGLTQRPCKLWSPRDSIETFTENMHCSVFHIEGREAVLKRKTTTTTVIVLFSVAEIVAVIFHCPFSCWSTLHFLLAVSPVAENSTYLNPDSCFSFMKFPFRLSLALFTCFLKFEMWKSFIVIFILVQSFMTDHFFLCNVSQILIIVSDMILFRVFFHLGKTTLFFSI